MLNKSLQEIESELREALDKMMLNEIQVYQIKSITNLVRDDGRISVQFVIGYDSNRNPIKTRSIVFGKARHDNFETAKRVLNISLLFGKYQFLRRPDDEKKNYIEFEEF